MKLPTLVLVFLMFLSSMVSAQDEITIDDYNRAVGFIYNNYNKKVFNLNIEPNWFPDSTGVWFVNQSLDNKKYLKITFPNHVQSVLFDHLKLSQVLSDSLGVDVKENDLPISKVEYKSPSELVITAKNKTYVLNTETYSLSPKKEDIKTKENEKPSPNNKWIAYSKDYNLYIKSTETEEIKQLSTKGKKEYEYATWYGWDDIIEGENGDRPDHFDVDWSENGEWISANICDLRSAQKMYLLDHSVDTLYRPKLLSYYRGSPGDTSMVYVEPVFFNINSGKEIKVGLPRSTHINSVGVTWSKTPGKVFLERMSRGYQNIQLYTFDLNTESIETLYSETSKTNIDNFTSELAEKSNLMFFLSEKSGWRQLYSLDLKTKKEKSITNGAFYINSIERIDEENQKIFFMASGKEEARNPYYEHLYSISFNGKNLKLLTTEDRHHKISFSPNGDYFIDNFSTVNIPTTTVLRKATTGEILMNLGHADVTLLKDWGPPEIFTAIAHDGKTTIYGAIWKPTNFDSSKSYPVIEYSYTGPHTQLFPKEFSQALWLQSYAELGFAAIVVDGLGSSGRSKQFHNYSYKNLGGNLEDHVIAIKQLGKQYSWIDTTRVGIFGHSAGGYDAGHAVLKYPNFYKVAVASSADHDHRMEKAWWPEMYMGWPVDSAYHLQSNITMAGNLKGKLLITHGGIDENVNPSATFKLAEALIKADKRFDMLIIPSQRHIYQGDHSKYFRKIKWNYFVEHLRGVEPIWDFKWDEIED
ncbi:DPP IV N-terminal domain-containing protein [Zeaxanthinibacter sp. PT1]|uniref:S9 family peptidase n=1 Tax=Zeaxanthinibacter TaxID=561554 RepID=UPI00234BB50B|nr:DPP IV N-terminal domain-containing protein [Zeaxanthinibacter sp. PT1]MDC6350072.1 DPP IV N-terminal domain-containing protein [Zeaxanthinibacter sp. PT1]